MATKTEEPQMAKLKEANHLCRVAIHDCETLLKRSEEMLVRQSKQDNQPRR